MNTRIWLACAAVLLGLGLLSASLRAAPAESGGERILQQELKQQQIQRTTQRVGQMLAAIIAEFDNNGISGEDLRTLKAIRTVLDRLSEKEMNRVLALLGEARSSSDASGGKQQLAGAYSGQRTIITLLKQLLLEFERQQALYELSIRFREMAARQGKNMRAGVWIARNNPQAQFNEEQKLNIQMQQTDQVHIKEDVAVLVARLSKLASESDGTATGERPKVAAKQVQEGGLINALETAAVNLKARKLLSATGNEKKARDELRELARLLLMSKDALDLLRAAIVETEAAIMLQKQVLEETGKVEKREEGLVAEDHQFEVVDATDLIRRDVQDIAPAAASYFRPAIDRMQETRELLMGWDSGEKKRREGTARQREAITNLELARRALQDQLAKAEAAANQPEGVLEHLKELQRQVQELAKEEAQLKEDSAKAEKQPQALRAKAPEQGDLKDKTQDAQQQAANEAPAAAQALNEAATEMEKSQKALAKSQNAPENQQAAVNALNRADQELGKQISHLEDAEKQLAALEKLSDKMENLIKDQEKVNLGTAQEAAKPAPSPSATKDLSQQEKSVAKETSQAQQEAAQSAPAAAPHLGEAQAQMNQANDQLGKPDAKSAQAPEKKALSELFAAKQQIQSKMSELQQELGQTDTAAEMSMTDASAALEKAQNEVNRALAQMANAPPGLIDSLARQEQQIAAALGEKAKDPSSPQADQARKAAAKAAEQLGQGDLQQAIGSMEKAQQAIQAAQAAEATPAQPTPPPNDPQGQAAPPSAASLPELGQQQAEVKKQAEALLAAQQAAPASAMDNAAQELTQAAKDVTPVAAGEMGALPPAAQTAVQAALDSLNNATGQAAAHQRNPAQAQATKAAQELAKAQAALALAEAGLGSEMAQAEEGNEPGQGPPQAQGQAPGKPQPGQGKGQGKQPGQQPGKGTPSPRGTGQRGNWNGPGGANGPRRQTSGPGQYVGLPKRDRAAIQQSQAESYPQEYGPMVEQYLKNLSDQAGQK